MDNFQLTLWIPTIAMVSAAGFLIYMIHHVTKGEEKGEVSNGKGNTVVIGQDRYNQLLGKERMLDALRQAGVKDWNGYPEAQNLYHEWSEGESNNQSDNYSSL